MTKLFFVVTFALAEWVSIVKIPVDFDQLEDLSSSGEIAVSTVSVPKVPLPTVPRPTILHTTEPWYQKYTTVPLTISIIVTRTPVSYLLLYIMLPLGLVVTVIIAIYMTCCLVRKRRLRKVDISSPLRQVDVYRIPSEYRTSRTTIG